MIKLLKPTFFLEEKKQPGISFRKKGFLKHPELKSNVYEILRSGLLCTMIAKTIKNKNEMFLPAKFHTKPN